MTDRYYKQTRALPTVKTSANHFANILLDLWIVPFDIPSYLPADEGTKFISKFFASQLYVNS